MLGIYIVLGTIILPLVVTIVVLYRNRRNFRQPSENEQTISGSGASLVSKNSLVGREQSMARLLESRLLRTLNIQTEIIRKIADNAPLQSLLEQIVVFLEREVGEIYCAIMLAEMTSMRLYCGAAPNLPKEFVQAIDGVNINNRDISCSLAILNKKVIIVEDMEQDETWTENRETLAKFGIRSCCSAPLLSREMKPLGTIAFYSKKSGRPDSVTLSYLQIVLDLAAITLEHQHRDRNKDEREANLRALFNNDNQINILLDKYRSVRRINDAGIRTIKKLFGESISAGGHLKDFLPPAEFVSWERAIQRAFQGETIRGTRNCVGMDGKVYWYEVAYIPIRKKNGKTSTVSLSAYDVTEKVNTEKELEKYQQRLHALVQNSTDIISIVSAEGIIVFESPSVEKICGYKPEELIGKSAFELVHPDERSYAQRVFETAIKSGRFEIPHVEIRVQHKDGHWVYLEMLGTVMLDNQVINGVVISSRRIDERKEAEIALRESEERFRAIFENTGIGIVLLGLDNSIVESNFAFQKMLKYTAGDLKQLKLEDVITAEDAEQMKPGGMEELLGKQGNAQNDIRFTRGDGKTIWGRITINLVKQSDDAPQFAVCMVEDITEQLRALQALRKSEEKYRTLFRGIPVGLYRTTPNGKILDANPALVAMLGYDDKNSLLRIPANQLYAQANDRKRWFSIIEQVGLVRSFDVALKRTDGSRIWVRENSSAVKDRKGNILFIEGSIEDVTLNKRMERRLASSEEQYRDLVENSEDFIFTHDLQGKILTVNQACVKQLGFQYTTEIVGKRLNDFMLPQLNRLMPLYLRQISRRKHYSGNATLLNKRGDEIILEFRNSVRSGTGEEPTVRGIARDVTQKIHTQQALAIEKERLSVTLRNIGDGVITSDLDGNIMLMNKVACELTGIAQDGWWDRNIMDTFRIKQSKVSVQYENTLGSVLKTGRTIRMEQAVRLLSFDEHERLITFYASALHDKSNRRIGIVVVFRDVGKMLSLEEQVINAHKLESLGLLAGGIAHDFNNYLTVIMGNVSLAKTTCELGDPMHTRLYEVEMAAARARNLTEQLLTFARGGAPVKKTASLVDIVRETTDFVLRGRPTTSDYSILEDVWPVEVDKGQMSQVINNLVLNASQAMLEGGIISIAFTNEEITPLNQHWAARVKDGEYVKLTIRDRGEGIPAADLPYIFDPYFTTKNQGNGLGLATSFSIIQRHEGYIFVSSQAEYGTTFTILLPACPEAVVTQEIFIDEIEQGSGRILVVDDEEPIREVLTRMLETLGYSVESANDGKKAIEMYIQFDAAGEKFDAVIMDLIIPGGIGGKEAVKTLLQYDTDLKAIVSSGYSNDPVMARHMEYGFIDKIMKPYNLQIVSKVVKRVVYSEVAVQGDPAGE